MTRIFIFGVSGKMGRFIVDMAKENPTVTDPRATDRTAVLQRMETAEHSLTEVDLATTSSRNLRTERTRAVFPEAARRTITIISRYVSPA